jgi:hypothetical protein
MGPGTVIDLDRYATGTRSTGPAPRPRWWRGLSLALATAVCATALVSSTALPDARLVEITTLGESSVVTEQVAGASLFTLTPGDGAARLTAFRLADARRLWQTPLAINLATTSIDVVGDTVLLTSDQVTEAVDAGTGRPLWHSDLPRLPTAVRDGHVLVAAFLDRTDTGPAGPSLSIHPPLLMRALNLRTGQPVWSYQVPAGWLTALPDDPSETDPLDRFIVVTPDGQASAVDLATGTPRATATIPVTPAALGDNTAGPWLALLGGQLVVGYLRQGSPTLTVYRTDTLAAQWTTTVPTLDIGVTRCASLLCLSDVHGVRAVAAATGTAVWTRSGAAWFGLVDGWIYDAPQPFESGSARLVDPVTARTVLDLGRWRLSTQTPGRPPLLEWVEKDSGRIWLALLTPGLRIQVLGAVTDLAQNTCGLGDSYLACMTIAHQLRIWRYRSSP